MVNNLIKALLSNKFYKAMKSLGLVLYNQE